jgi:hypothetical protein
MRNTLLTTVLLCSALLAQAATVTSTSDSGPGSLRAAIAGAANGETITFAVSGTIVLSSGEILINKDLTILGPGVTNLTVQRSTAAATPDFRIFNIDSGIVSLSGLTIANGRANEGAGINNETTFFLSNCVIPITRPPNEAAESITSAR